MPKLTYTFYSFSWTCRIFW